MTISKFAIGSALFGMLASAAWGMASPPAASKPAVNACDVAREYIRLTDEKQYDQVGELWADDAVFYNPAGEVIRGKPAIKQFYSRFLRQITPINRIASLAFDPQAGVCVMELETRVIMGPDGKWVPNASGDFVPTAIDRFVVNKDGKVQQMRVYLPNPKAWLEK